MAKKEFTYKGKTMEELKKLSMNELAELLPSGKRRKIRRGFTEQEKILLKNLRAGKQNVKTHCRDMIILPEMMGMIIKVYKGKEYAVVTIEPDMIGHCLGEFALTRSRVTHSAPGIGATRSSASLSVK